MPFEKGKSGNPNGRKNGSPNKLTAAAKLAIETAAEGLGGAKRLEAWVREDPLNERAFWTQIYTKLLPLQVTDGEGKSIFPEGGIVFSISQLPGSENQT